MLKKSIEDKVRKALEDDSQLASYDRGKLSAALSKANLALDDVRTTRDDPDSSRKYCNAKVNLRFPEAILRIIDDARSSAGLEDRSSVANRNGLIHDATGFTSDFEYSIQPTDDGKKVIAESDADSAMAQVVSELFSSYLLSDEIRNAKVSADQAESKRAADERALAAQESAAKGQLASATLEEAIAENKLAVQRISAVWQSIPPSTRRQLASIQTAWNKRISAQCTVEASGQSTEPSIVKAAKLRCESNALMNRSRELERFASYNDANDAASDAASGAADAADAAADAARRM
jgi:hypothetical protein